MAFEMKVASLLDSMKALTVAVVAYSPLGNPELYGENSGMNSAVVSDIAAETGLMPAQVMINFLVAQGWIVVPKSVTPSRIDQNINFELKLTSEHIAKIARDAPQKRLANPKNRPGGLPVFVDEPIEPRGVEPRGAEL
mmetsp:Transcript_177823/g.570278  ORF Transcript_177823/g.570278 Transcript_177823/m.570278 type:complete len:138 (+) Transcript_177823:55-468(+)